jgi:parallel beta-helix repeat protein
MGFSLTANCTIKNCSADNNLGDGIRVTSDCLVVENSCRLNFAGIHATASNNRIEGNNVVANGRGLNIDVAGSLILKNSASDNTIDYAIAANNRYGPIVDISAAGAPAVSGKSAADTTTTTHPWANFSY